MAELDRVGCFKYEDVDGAAANDLPGHVDEDEKDERWERLMETQRQISAKKMGACIGHIFNVLIDEVDVDGAIGRTYADAPEIDSLVYVAGSNDLTIGERIPVRITDADDYDLFGGVTEGSSTAATN